MLRRSPSARRTAARGFGSAVTLALALAGGAAVVTAATAAPAAAQNAAPTQQRAQAAELRGLRQGLRAGRGDRDRRDAATSPRPRRRFRALVAAIQTPDDRNAAGNLILIARQQAQGHAAPAPGPRADGRERQDRSGAARPVPVLHRQPRLRRARTGPPRAPRCRRRIAAGYTRRQSRGDDRRNLLRREPGRAGPRLPQGRDRAEGRGGRRRCPKRGTCAASGRLRRAG